MNPALLLAAVMLSWLVLVGTLAQPKPAEPVVEQPARCQIEGMDEFGSCAGRWYQA